MTEPEMSWPTMMGYLKRRVDFLARRLVEGEAVGRHGLTWDRGEMLAIQAAITRLEMLEKLQKTVKP